MGFQPRVSDSGPEGHASGPAVYELKREGLFWSESGSRIVVGSHREQEW